MSPSPEASDASHESDQELPDANGTGKSQSTTVKDKACPYCRQKFTSSSLGRHLDQYIFKKKPDGIHDVEEIKKLRAGITRRSARGKKAHDEEPEHTVAVDHPVAGAPNPVATGLPSVFNKTPWQATGVIQDTSVDDAKVPTPNTAISAISPFPAPAIQTGTKRNFSTYAADMIPSSSSETLRALELSLREVLDAINVAFKKTEPTPEPFSFDIHAQTFPSLCLALLPPPPTLWQAAPFQTATSTSIAVPGHEQLDTLRITMADLIDGWKWDALAHVQKTAQNGINVGHEADRLSSEAELYKSQARSHLDTAFNFFINQHPDQQQHQWNVELLRALSREKNKNKTYEEQIQNLSQDVERLQQQIGYLERCQWPREMALWPPERNTISTLIQKELKTSSPVGNDAMPSSSRASSKDRWDYDTLLNKWKRHVREDRARRGQIPSLDQSESVESATASPMLNQRAPLKEMNSPAHVNGSRQPSLVEPGGGGRPFLGFRTTGSTPAAQSMLSASRTQTPVQSGIQIVSDIGDTFARFAPYLRQKDLEERSGT